MTTPVDVVVVAYRSAAVLPACLRSVVGDPAVARVVVVDNDSPDDSAGVARVGGAEVVDAGANLGFGAGCNRGMAATDAPYVLLLNPDAAVRPGTVAGLRDHLDAEPRAAVVASELVAPDGRPEPNRRRFPRLRLAPFEPGLSARADDSWYGRRRAGDPAVDWVVGACLLVRRSAFEQVGGFDERYFLYAEETDLCARLGAAGWRIHWIPGFPADHAGGASTSTLPAAGKEAWVDGWLRFVRTHGRHPGALRALLAMGFAGRAVVWRVAGRRDAARMWWSAARRAVSSTRP